MLLHIYYMPTCLYSESSLCLINLMGTRSHLNLYYLPLEIRKRRKQKLLDVK